MKQIVWPVWYWEQNLCCRWIRVGRVRSRLQSLTWIINNFICLSSLMVICCCHLGPNAKYLQSFCVSLKALHAFKNSPGIRTWVQSFNKCLSTRRQRLLRLTWVIPAAINYPRSKSQSVESRSISFSLPPHAAVCYVSAALYWSSVWGKRVRCVQHEHTTCQHTVCVCVQSLIQLSVTLTDSSCTSLSLKLNFRRPPPASVSLSPSSICLSCHFNFSVCLSFLTPVIAICIPHKHLIPAGIRALSPAGAGCFNYCFAYNNEDYERLINEIGRADIAGCGSARVSVWSAGCSDLDSCHEGCVFVHMWGREDVYLKPSCHVCLCAAGRAFGCLSMMKM